jgi:hypothetical protein
VNYSGRKRVPLPPQSIHFRDSKRTTSPAKDVSYSSDIPPSRSAHTTRDIAAGEAPQHSYVPPTSEHRNQAFNSTRSSASEQGPPSAPSSRPSRFNDNNPGVNVARQFDHTNVDISSDSRVGRADASTRIQGGMYADREEVVMDALPKGPRAMVTKSSPRPSLVPSAAPAHVFSAQQHSSSRNWQQRSPPPHLIGEEKSTPRAPAIRPISSINSKASSVRQESRWENLPSEVVQDKAKTGPEFVGVVSYVGLALSYFIFSLGAVVKTLL